jgi:RND family efflux transporter MFP subunit
MRAFFHALAAPVRALARRRGGVPLLLLLGTILIIVVLFATRQELAPVEQPERVWPVEAIEIRRQSVQPRLTLFGETVAGRRSELRALVSGPIVKIGENFHEGGLVAAGDLLIQVDPFAYETMLAERRAQLREAEVRLEQLRRDLRRTRDLFAQKSVSQRDLDNAELSVEQQEAVVEQRRIDVQRAQRNLADTRLTAPYAGVVGNVNANLGKHLGTNDKVADLIDTSALEVRFSLSNDQYGRLLQSDDAVVGRPVEITWTVGRQAITWPGHIARVGAEITSATGGVDVYAVLDTGGRQITLRPGAFVSVTVPDRRYEDVFVAPETSLYGANEVFVIEDERLAARRVRVVGYSGHDVLFVADGEPALADGDRVVTTQLREAGAGVRVSVRTDG